VLHFSFSWIALAAAVLLGILTIYLSAVSSARRASKVSPITAIRDSGAVKSNAKKLRTPWLVKRLFGVGGVIAHKNIRRNRRKYRTTVLSIIVSVAVFVALSSFMALTNDTLKFEFQSEGWNLCYLCFTVALRCKMTVISRCCDVSALTGDGRMYMEHNEHLKRTIWASVLTTVLTLVCVGAALHAGAPLFVVLVLNLLGFGVVIGLFLAYNRWKNRELVKITHLIEEINRRNYALDIDNISEEELSILKNEIYKTTLFLKSQAENSLKDKETLKEALSDISHQLKTPLTSCLVMLDNMLDDPEMEPAVREDFIRGVKRELGSVNFLVQSILKLSRFDVNAVTFHREPMSLAELVEEAVKNVSLLCDLKDVRLDIKQDSEPCGDSNRLICDRRWEIEAITNILKNAVEHSPAGEVVEIAYEQNRAYARLSIRDYGEGITGEEETHIFERYYRGRHAGEDSVGIGLALARTIIGQDGGQVYAERMERGMRFQIRWVYSFQDGNEE
ncbi:MAG: HAMP domain-containing histidine kinase, partial [Lachnospiraceae bacterium]|nr:HAMP domain-containing histidine kinase [Lachnospiraceae bacterium]